MVVEYATWEVDTSDPEAYFAWMFGLGDECRAEKGCMAYDYRVDRRDPYRASLFQAWATQEAFEAHLVFPAHQQMTSVGHEWAVRNLVIRRWSAASGYHERRRM
jgi:quinol monooxygenase YgiN